MKNSLFIFSMLLLIGINTCKAQDADFKKPLVHVNKEGYNVIADVPHGKNADNIHNRYFKSNESPVPKNALPPGRNDIRYDRALIVKIFFETFSPERIKDLAQENLNLLIGFDNDLKGNVLEISFSFADNSSLKPVEIEKLETLLKKQVKFTLSDTAFKGWKYVYKGIFVDFKKLSDHTPTAVYP
jgi:hypothetical protein